MRFYRNKTEYSRKALAACLALLCALLSSCGEKSAPPEQTAAPVVTSQSAPQEDTAPSAESGGEISGTSVSASAADDTEVTSETSLPDDIADITETEDTSPPETEPADTSSAPTETPAKETEPPAPVTEAAPAPQTPAETPAVTTTVSTTAQKPPAEVVIPKIRAASSPGTKTVKNDKAVLDYSNASDGYISLTYTGKSAKAKVRIICGDQKNDHSLAVGGVTEYYPLSLGNGNYQIQAFEQVDGNFYQDVIDETISVKITNAVDMYVYPNKYVNFSQNSAVVKKSAEICAGKNTNIEKLAAIFQYITSNVTYDKQLAATVQKGYVPDPDTTLSKKTGICFDYASLFAAMARAQGIPTQLVIGYASPDIYHAWNQVYTSETGWITVELFLKNNGFNLADATFYSSASDKEKIAKYISDTKNYSPLYIY